MHQGPDKLKKRIKNNQNQVFYLNNRLGKKAFISTKIMTRGHGSERKLGETGERCGTAISGIGVTLFKV